MEPINNRKLTQGEFIELCSELMLLRAKQAETGEDKSQEIAAVIEKIGYDPDEED